VVDAIDRAEILMEKDGLPKRNGTHFGTMLDKPEHPTPHKFRHTFAATLLQGGAPLRLVAQYLGDTEKTVREHYSKFCVVEQEQAAERLSEAMARYDAQTLADRKARLKVVK
jgi:integrase